MYSHKIIVQVKSGSKVEKIIAHDESHFSIWVKERAQEGKANIAASKALARYVRVPWSHLQIVKGKTSKEKVFIIA